MPARVAHPESIVETDWVAEHLGDEGVVVVEVDVDTAAYDQGHIPGAIGWNWTTELNDTVTRDILSREQMQRLLGGSGITKGTTVVLYGDNNNWFATYAFWQMKLYGHRRVKIMNGGRVKWVKEGRELSYGRAVAHEADVSRVGRGYEHPRDAGLCAGDGDDGEQYGPGGRAGAGGVQR